MEDEAVAQYLCASECVNPIQMMSMEQYQGWNLTTLSFVKTWNTIFLHVTWKKKCYEILKNIKTRSQKMRGRLWKHIILWENDPNVLVFMRVLAHLLTFFPDLYLELEGYISPFGNLFKKACGQHVLDQMFQNFKVFQSLFFFFFYIAVLFITTHFDDGWLNCIGKNVNLLKDHWLKNLNQTEAHIFHSISLFLF